MYMKKYIVDKMQPGLSLLG